MTAVKWLIKELDFLAREHYLKKITTIEYHLCVEAAHNKAIDLEKNQIMDAYRFGVQDEYIIGAEHYYLKQL